MRRLFASILSFLSVISVAVCSPAAFAQTPKPVLTERIVESQRVTLAGNTPPAVFNAENDRGLVAVRQAQHRLQFLLDTGGAGLVGFIDGEDVGDFEDAGFDGLYVVSHARD